MSLYVDGMRALPSRFQVGDPVRARGRNGIVTGVLFRNLKVWYEVDGALYPSEDIHERLEAIVGGRQ